MAIDISLGCKRYPWTRPLVEGEIRPTGVDLTVIDDYTSPEYYTRMLDTREFDMAELSLGAYLASLGDPEYQLTAIPVFPHRTFRHSYLYVRDDGEFATPADLAGQTVGMINWEFTGGLWARGTVQENHGLDLTSVEWRTSRPEYVPVDVPDRYRVSRLDADGSGGTGTVGKLERALLDGTVDAVISPTELRTDGVTRLFSDPFEVEQEYYRTTGIFPIHHVVVVRNEVVEEQPWLPNKMYEAFDEALDSWFDQFETPGWSKRSPFVWGLNTFEEQSELFDECPWEHGLDDSNRRNLSQLVQYAVEQGVVETRYDVDDLFVDNVGV